MNGYGLGNSTRIHAIIQHIGKDCEIDVFSFGNSLEYFAQVSEIQNIFQGFPLEYGLKNGKIDFLATMAKAVKNFKAIYDSRNRIRNIVDSRHYNLVVSDSNFFPFFLKNRPKLISISNADVIVKRALKTEKRGSYIQFLKEFGDYIYDLCIPDLTISPFFEPCKDIRRIQHTSVLVRKEFQRSHQLLKKHHVFIMTGGAVAINQDVSIDHNRNDYDLSVLGDQIRISGQVKREKKTFNVNSLMNQSTIVVINGGFSSIAEALAMAKPMVVIPLKGHMEQKVNALWIQNNDFGLMSSWEELEASIVRVKNNYMNFKNNLLGYNYLNGAERAASLILKELENEDVR